MRKQLRAACQTGPKSHYRESLFCSPCRNAVATKSAARGEPARTQRNGKLLLYQHKLRAAERQRTTANRHTMACGAISESVPAIEPRARRGLLGEERGGLPWLSEKQYQLRAGLARNCQFFLIKHPGPRPGEGFTLASTTNRRT